MKNYLSASDVETAFYEAFERADIKSMMATWGCGDGIVCIHPGADRMEGFEEVKESWEVIFEDPSLLRFTLLDVRITAVEGLAIHQVKEEVEIDGQYISHLFSTNVYVKGEDKSWMMISRHSSPEPELPDFEALDYEDLDADQTVVLH